MISIHSCRFLFSKHKMCQKYQFLLIKFHFIQIQFLFSISIFPITKCDRSIADFFFSNYEMWQKYWFLLISCFPIMKCDKSINSSGFLFFSNHEMWQKYQFLLIQIEVKQTLGKVSLTVFARRSLLWIKLGEKFIHEWK